MFMVRYVFLLHLLYVVECKRIWLIRHCDKPKNPKNPCCSDLGYARASQWHSYFAKYIEPKSKIQIYASNYNENLQCMMPPSFFYDSMANTHCQKSQRMFITANTLYSNLHSTHDHVNLISKYCVGEKRQLIDDILRDDTIEDSIVVWEHHEIIQIIREFGISIDKWRNHFIDEYSLVFQIDVEPRILHYDCFDFQSNQHPCPKSIDLWLTPVSYTHLTLPTNREV